MRRIPEVLVQAVEDADEVRPARQQVAVKAHPVLGTEHLARVRRAHGVDHVRPPDSLAQEIDAPGVADWRVVAEPQLGNPIARRPAVIREVVDRQGDRGGADRRVRVVREVPQDPRRAGVPVVERDDVHGPALGAPGLERGAGQEREAPHVVGVLRGRIAVDAVPVERRRVVDQAQPVSRRIERADRDLRGPAWGQGIRDAQGEGGNRTIPGVGNRAVARQEDLDRLVEGVGHPPQRPRERVHHVAEAARLGPRLALGGDEDHAHEADGTPPACGSVRRPVPCD